MDCKEVGKTLFLFFDNEMAEELLTSFRAHVDRCDGCAKQVRYTRKFLLVLRERCIRCSAPDALRDRILTSIRPPH
ncbi:MAG: zf-HC2 domain-containing protein [Acidobacteriota bacterium]|nr:zf-HC2 domain-containing protein [Acidobacteriota bacterium]